ncbi:MAG: hypothetical protein J6V72_08510 [Kiritimatiellae bacterium]|nr:hypothetical protein [Kiritimatiellia bacterium]
MIDDGLTYSVRSGRELGDAEWGEVSKLFSASYGIYSQRDPVGRAGRQIRLSPGYYRRTYASDAYLVAVCREGERLVAEAVLRVCETSRGRAALVVQLVVEGTYRRHGVASRLLQEIWASADFCCMGVVTSTAFTVKALEIATARRVEPQVMKANEAYVRREILSGIGFLETAEWMVSNTASVIDSGFYTDRSFPSESTMELSKRLGVLPEGAEWLAVVFGG